MSEIIIYWCLLAIVCTVVHWFIRKRMEEEFNQQEEDEL
jgi:membrane protein insertase Oxa1/YidC/SpoIIIJ